jgi:hypothetical protein
MAEKQWGYPYPHEDKYAKYKPAHDESVSSPDMHYYESESESEPKYHKESPAVQPKYSYVPHAFGKTTVKVQKVKKVYDPGYASHLAKSQHCPPIVCDPQYVVRDCYIPREVPVVHPVVNVNRHIIVNVPKHYYQPITRNVVVDPGCPGRHRPGYY